MAEVKRCRKFAFIMEPSKRKKYNDRIEFLLSQEVNAPKVIVESEQGILISKKDKEIFSML